MRIFKVLDTFATWISNSFLEILSRHFDNTVDKVEKKTQKEPVNPFDFRHLPNPERVLAAKSKYADAVALYAASDLPLCRVAKLCGVTAAGLSAHIARNHRALLLARYGFDACEPDAIKVRPPKGQSVKTHLKYKEAIEACGDIAYIELNVSQIARLFNLNGPALASQLRVHYPHIVPYRERLRLRLGLADNVYRGPRAASHEAYEEALKIYRDTCMTIPQVAQKCNVSKGGFIQYMRFYHKDIIAGKEACRSEARRNSASRREGQLSGNGSLYGPKAETVARYAEALELYRGTPMTIRDIAATTDVPMEGFKSYMKQWHRKESRGRIRKAASAKYAPAIQSLRENPRSVAEVAAEFRLNPEVFRKYLKAHEPSLAAGQGMTRLADGRVVKKTSREKYKVAVHEFATTAEPLKSIAERHGFVYNSLLGYVLRNCPAERESHRKLVGETARPTSIAQ